MRTPEGDKYHAFVEAYVSPTEFTLKSVGLSTKFGAANAYLELHTGYLHAVPGTMFPDHTLALR